MASGLFTTGPSGELGRGWTSAKGTFEGREQQPPERRRQVGGRGFRRPGGGELSAVGSAVCVREIRAQRCLFGRAARQ